MRTIEENYKPTIGQSLRRREDEALLTGQGRFVDDVSLAGPLFVSFVRSAQPTGRLIRVDDEQARAAPGVVAVFTGADVASLGTLTVNKMLQHNVLPQFPILAGDRVLALGQPVAAIIADSKIHAEDAVELIEIEIDGACEGPVQLDTPALRRTGQQAIYPDIPDNVAMSSSYQSGDWKATAAGAAKVVSAAVSHPRLMPSPLETRSIAVNVDPRDNALTVWLSTQTPHRARQELARISGIDLACLRVVAPDIGGAFGMKASLYPEDVLVVWAAHQLGRSLRWVATRGEDMLSATHGRGAQTTGSLAVDTDGRFLALKADITCPLGYWLPTSAAVPAWNAARILPGPYDIATVEIDTRCVLTNTAPVGIYRGAGRPEAAALMERLVDEAAVATGLDPVEVRRRNLLPPEALPHIGPTGRVLDSGRYLAALARLCDLADYKQLRHQQRKRRESGEYVGLGFACYVEPCGQGWESASVTWRANGSVLAATGGSTQGQGRETAFAQIVASTLGAAIDSVEIRSGDTSSCPAGIGALASRSTAIGGSALLQAAQYVRDQVARDGWKNRNEVSAEVIFEAPGEAWGYGCYLAVVSVDDQTGQVRPEHIYCVDDAGTMINPAMVAGQIKGGIAQGIGEALLENVVYDDSGQLLTGSLMDYALPRAIDMPAISIDSLSTPSPVNLIGAKGVGEAGTIGAPAALLNAVTDALSPLGVKDIAMPMTSERVWQAIRNAVNGGD